jgi:hypothetical protein
MPNPAQFETHEDYLNWYREYKKKNAKKIRDYSREYNRKWRKENGYHNEANSKKRYPEKVKARMAVRWAIEKGVIIRGNCEVCNKPNAQAHHEDYLKPLEVRWLCSLHHKEHHKKISTA